MYNIDFSEQQIGRTGMNKCLQTVAFLANRTIARQIDLKTQKLLDPKLKIALSSLL